MNVVCKANYRNDALGLVYRPGDKVDEKYAAFLLNDSPGSFEVVAEVKAVEKPKRNKAVKRPTIKK